MVSQEILTAEYNIWQSGELLMDMKYTESEMERLQRSELLLGHDVMSRMAQTKVILFGVGGVGSWCAEALIRAGIKRLTIVDGDCVSISNCNRQLMATAKTVGMPKVDVMKERLLEINPDAEITAIKATYSAETADSFNIEDYDYVIDAIDSLKDKAHLILYATEKEGVKLLSSMGAALRIDPTKVTVSEFRDVTGDPLARALRKKFKYMDRWPKRKFRCAYSTELPLENKGETDESCDYKAVINGSMVHITGCFGFVLAGEIIKDLSK